MHRTRCMDGIRLAAADARSMLESSILPQYMDCQHHCRLRVSHLMHTFDVDRLRGREQILATLQRRSMPSDRRCNEGYAEPADIYATERWELLADRMIHPQELARTSSLLIVFTRTASQPRQSRRGRVDQNQTNLSTCRSADGSL